MKRSPVEAVERQAEAFQESVTEALCRLDESRKAFEETAQAIEAMLAPREERVETSGREAEAEPGVRLNRRGYAAFWLGVLLVATGAFAAGYWAAMSR
ncbi:MAG: hypothetical protein ACPL7M_08895 [Bryobacteraceae bacterium]